MTYAAQTRNKLQDHYLGQTVLSPPATYYAALFVAGVEVAAGGYARLEVPNTVTTFAGAAYSGSKSTSIALMWPSAATADWGDIDEVRLYDDPVAGTEWVRGTVTPGPKTVNAENVAYFEPGSIVFSLSSTWTTPITAIFTTGQSNDVGQETADAFGCPKNLTEDMLFWVRILGAGGEQLNPGTVQPLQRTVGDGLVVRGGPENQLGCDLIQMGVQKILILKVAESGTDVASWLPGAGTGRYEAIEEELANAVAAAAAQWPGSPIVWNFLFVNGESECGDPLQQYLANMKTYIAALRTTFEATGTIDEIIISQVSVNLGLSAEKTEVRAAQVQLVTDGDATAVINTDALSLQIGDLHWDGWALPNIGRSAGSIITGGEIPNPSGAAAATDWKDLIEAQGFEVMQYLQGDLGISGTTWEDTVGGFDMTAGGAPVHTAASPTLNNRGIWTYDGTDDTHVNSSASLICAPNLENLLFYGIFRVDSWSAGTHALWAADSVVGGCSLTRSGNAGVVWNNTAGSFRLTGFGLSHWRAVWGFFSNSALDEYGVGAEANRGSSLGGRVSTGRRIASDAGGTSFNEMGAALAIIAKSPMMDNFPRGLLRALHLTTCRYYGAGLVLPMT